MRVILSALIISFGLCGCNHITVKSGTLDTDAIVYADRGGYTMQRAAKDVMERRGYKLVVGRATSNQSGANSDASISISTYKVPKDAKYVVKVEERQEYFRPIWCSLNGFWWWRFNLSIASQETGEEILSWFGHGCADSSARLFDKLLNELEIKE